jgi:hypothetical protein
MGFAIAVVIIVGFLVSVWRNLPADVDATPGGHWSPETPTAVQGAPTADPADVDVNPSGPPDPVRRSASLVDLDVPADPVRRRAPLVESVDVDSDPDAPDADPDVETTVDAPDDGPGPTGAALVPLSSLQASLVRELLEPHGWKLRGFEGTTQTTVAWVEPIGVHGSTRYRDRLELARRCVAAAGGKLIAG